MHQENQCFQTKQIQLALLLFNPKIQRVVWQSVKQETSKENGVFLEKKVYNEKKKETINWHYTLSNRVFNPSAPFKI